MQLNSSPINTKPFIYQKCGGQNLTPTVGWNNIPDQTKSLAIVLHDPDAPVKNGWIHWIVYNIPPNVYQLKSNHQSIELPEGSIVAKNSYGEYGYGGPCPPPGKLHHYNLFLYALDSKLSLTYKDSPFQLLDEIQKHKIAETVLTSTYQRE